MTNAAKIRKKTKNARKGIETPVTLINPSNNTVINTLKKTKNARKGIETVQTSIAARVRGFLKKTKNARKGIET